MRVAAFIVVVSLAGACGTYSQIRTGKTLPAGAVELSAGAAVNGFGEGNPVGQVAVGLTDWLEVVGHWELQNGYGELRVGPLSEENHGINLAIGAGGGVGTTAGLDFIEGDEDKQASPLLTSSVALSRNFTSWLEIYLAGRALWLVPHHGVFTGRAGTRLGGSRFQVFLEGGATGHTNFGVIAEGAAGLCLSFGR